MALYEFEGRRPVLPAADAYWIAESASVIGDVHLGEEVSVWFGAVLRGDNEPIEIGARTNIQDQCMVHTDPGFPAAVGEGCTIGHQAILHGCRIGSNTLIGMGAILLNGSIIGRNCIIGAGALIPENKEIPDNSLVVGSPGRVIRSVDENGARQVAGAATAYVSKWKRYRSGMAAIN